MADSLVIGGQLGSYMIESVIGRGGMGVVYRAVHSRLGTPVAIKVLAPELGSDDAFRARFLREAKMAAGIDHPNVIPIYDTGMQGESLYIVMRFVSGGDLKTLLTTSGPLSLESTVSVLMPVARALDAAHGHGLVHRDVKPANILIQQSPSGEVEQVYLTDFGVTKHATSVSGLTNTGALVGTIDYMAPEQIEGNDVSAQTDIYALGCVFYLCVAGRVPFSQESEAAVLWAHMHKDLEPPSQVRPGLPPALDAAVAKATAKNPADRFATCEDFIRACSAATEAGQVRSSDLKGFTGLAGATVAESAQPPPPPAGRPHSPDVTMPDREPVLAGNAPPPAGPAAPAPPGASPPPPPKGSGGPRDRSWLSQHWWVAGLIVLVVGGICAAALALTSGDDSSSGSKNAAQKGDKFPATLAPVPTNNVKGSGSATVTLDGRKATVSVNTTGLLDPAVHPMHIHAGGRGRCPTRHAAHHHGGNLAISTVDGEPAYGPPVTALTSRGDTSKQSILVFGRFPHVGKIRYTRTFRVPAKTARLIRRQQASVIVHGIDYNGNGVYDGVLDRSDLNPQLNGETTAPGLCGRLVAAKKSSSSKADAGSDVYTASLSTPKADRGWIEVR